LRQRQRQHQRVRVVDKWVRPIFKPVRLEPFKTDYEVLEPQERIHYSKLAELPHLVGDNVVRPNLALQFFKTPEGWKPTPPYHDIPLSQIAEGTQAVIVKTDFDREMDRKAFLEWLQPLASFVTWTTWQAEGLGAPFAARAPYIAKLLVRAGETIYIRVPAFAPISGLISAFASVYLPSGIEFIHYFVAGGRLDVTRQKFPKRFAGIDSWARVFASYISEAHWGGIELVIEIANTTTEDKYVYVAYIAVSLLNYHSMQGRPYIAYLVRHAELTLSAESISFSPFYHHVYGVISNPYAHFDIGLGIAGDGVNPITATISITGVDLISISRVSDVYDTYWSSPRVKTTMAEYTIKLTFSTAGTGKINFISVWARPASPFRWYNKRSSDSYTSDGDGATDTVVLLDYRTSTKHVKKLSRIKATGDVNTTQLQLRIDDQVVWDFLTDGDTCDIPHENAKLVELLVNDPGAGTTTTVSYTYYYEEGEGFLVK